MNRANTLNKFGEAAWGASTQFEGYLADFVHLDGQYLEYDSFAEFKNGVLIPIDTSGLTYGTNGFRLEFKQTGVGSGASNTIGADTSGQNNHLDSAIIAADDCAMPDSPENNFATYNPLQIAAPSSSFFLSEGNLALTATNNSGYRNCSATFSPMGFKGYIEFVASALNHKIGIIADTTYPTNQDYANSGPQHVTLEYNGEVKFPNNGTSHRSASDHNLGTLSAGDVMGMAFDFTGTNRNVWFHRANTYGTASGGLGNPATGANPIVTASNLNSTGPYRFHFGINNGPVFRINFGQDGTFGGTETAQGNTDANGNGDFYYAVPAGFLALCSANLPEPTIGPNSLTQADDHFNTVLYSGTGNADTITTGLQPDWIWIKQRNGTGYHNLTDTSRGITRELHSNVTDTETNYSRIASTSSTGFTFESGANGYTNESGSTFVAWNWKANGGTTSTNEDGDVDSVVQANPTAGFSIVTYTANNSNSTTVGHGMGIKPDIVIQKNRSATSNWLVLHQLVDGTVDYHLLDSTSAGGAGAQPASTTSTIATWKSSGSDTTGNLMVAYCFASIEGYSRFGIYSANNSTDGAFVFTNFTPAFIKIGRAHV